ncbi:hypothetical protein K469DRAFT_581041, partial [Zopfia rhizophila CBS 207.26]
FEKQGFREVGRLEVDLDEFVPRPPDERERVKCRLEGDEWRVYVLMHMKRMMKEG